MLPSVAIWRWMLLFAMLPAIGLLVGLLCASVPESPRWLAAQQRFEEALAVLRSARKSEAAAMAELEDMRKTVEQEEREQLNFW